MLMRNPKEFDRVAQEWAVKYAGAPKRERGEGSGGSSTETLKQKQQKSKEEEEAERVARHVLPKHQINTELTRRMLQVRWLQRATHRSLCSHGVRPRSSCFCLRVCGNRSERRTRLRAGGGIYRRYHGQATWGAIEVHPTHCGLRLLQWGHRFRNCSLGAWRAVLGKRGARGNSGRSLIPIDV